MSGGITVVEELAATFGLSVAPQGFQLAEELMHGLHHGALALAGAFGGAVVAIAEIVESVGEAGDHAARMAEKVGISTQALQGLEFAAHMADVSAESLQSGLKFLGKSAGEAASGSEEFQKAFRDAGVHVTDSVGKIRPLDELLSDLSDKFQKMPESVEKNNLAIKLLGRGGLEMKPLLNKGSEAIKEFMQEAEDLGLVMSKETIKDAEEYADEMKMVGASLTGLRNAVGAPLLKQFAEYLKAISKFIRTHKDVIAVPIVTFFKKLGDVMHWLVGESASAQFAVGALETGLWGLAAVATVAGAEMIAVALASAAAWLYAAAPVIALGAAIGLIADDLYVFAKGGDSVLGRLIKWFNTIDPNDNQMLAAFKAIAAVVFDITDPKKWDRMVEAVTAAAVKMNAAIKKALWSPVTGSQVNDLGLGTDDPNAGKSPLDLLSKVWSFANSGGSSGDDLLTGAVHTPASGVQGSMNKQITVNAPVTIHTQPGADADEVARKVSEAMDAAFTEAHAHLR